MTDKTYKYLSSIAHSLKGIHEELKKINDTNPIKQLQKQQNTSPEMPKNFL